ncbi:shikimate dehydrogenase [Trichlorobacter lovleyi]|uniref:Shikimate dehydrogenase (NADP(+)) n=1 Tax=Trichlorobacter lovleyi (strain ATCC BAA-1151 / DSM 17278 / SZ) TaxID=398767 RepID=B3EAD0_TRIL1|nr:shikimate dehydrogenase [Trichlorobacter lovleyi]ACD95368.1 shikimate 5-dehydrogenase [Trichlorobacter lovleyi SZ]
MNVESIVTGKTKVYGIIGWPVAHSLSPVMQNAALQAAAVDAIYVPFAVAPDQLATAISGLRAMHVSGFNVTIPHKTAIMTLLDELSPVAVQAGAVNTVVNQGGRLIGHNTDGDGLVISLEEDLNCPVTGSNVVLVGAGGAACGALAALCRAGVRSVVVLNRNLNAAEGLIASFRDHFPHILLRACTLGEQPEEVLRQSDLVINATSLGMSGEKIEGLSLALLPDHAKVYDMVYNASLTTLLHDADKRGVKAVNGLGMLIAQGELAFELWHGIPAARGVMRTALQSFLSSAAKA